MDVDAYAERHTTPVAPFLADLERETRETQESPGMLTGTLAGRFLATLAYALQARRVLEIGTFTGYSALSIAEALPPDGRIVSCELDPDRAAFARARIEAAGYGDRVEIRVGPALDTVHALEGPFDLVFIDADKAGYPAYFDAALERLAPHGLIVLDNMLMGHHRDDATGRAIHALNERLAAQDGIVATLFPVRDGMTVIRHDRTPG
jgi:caffeoyl-CoA O-methyltransferase